MSDVPPKADISANVLDFRYVPILLQKSAAKDGALGHFAKDERL